MPVGTWRFSVSQFPLMSDDQKMVPLCCAPMYASRARMRARVFRSRRKPS